MSISYIPRAKITSFPMSIVSCWLLVCGNPPISSPKKCCPLHRNKFQPESGISPELVASFGTKSSSIIVTEHVLQSAFRWDLLSEMKTVCCLIVDWHHDWEKFGQLAQIINKMQHGTWHYCSINVLTWDCFWINFGSDFLLLQVVFVSDSQQLPLLQSIALWSAQIT